ncbi:hypothetical protein PYW08_012518 [Mythimna loreyi]|uniref:Uncharacterized protein n=1 Tax=Mythimna loreyi TaxID=667449 RepID=A0ACC2Q193_9NEOP|nr:hypothetical protein PYW08_012518 [Mythimna loreyi]
MNVIYTSQKLHELFSDDPHPTHANASGDGDGAPGRCCRLCGGDNNLRYFGDTYVWEGVEERYDHLLNDCFGVKVTPSDCMICEWCVRALRTTGRFRALVHAAFDHPNSDLSSSLATLKSSNRVKKQVKLPEKPDKDELAKKPIDPAKRREDRRRVLGGDAKAKRTNIPCDICKQRYPMLVNALDSYKNFVCSRCKKNGELKGSVCRKCNISMPDSVMTEHIDLHAKADARRNFKNEERKRVPHQPRKLLIPDAVRKPRSHKFQCNQCPKKYALARHLALHVTSAHGDSLDDFCPICNQDIETNEKLKDHLIEHSGVHLCDECHLTFKNRKTLVAHNIKHHTGSTTS